MCFSFYKTTAVASIPRLIERFADSGLVACRENASLRERTVFVPEAAAPRGKRERRRRC